jgi:hypothetical protein
VSSPRAAQTPWRPPGARWSRSRWPGTPACDGEGRWSGQLPGRTCGEGGCRRRRLLVGPRRSSTSTESARRTCPSGGFGIR